VKRTNEQWINELQGEGHERDAAILDLTQILVSGLQRGLLGRVNTSVPEFESLAEDFAQEAVLKILDNLHTFAGRSQFTTWAHKIAVSVALTELRRKRWQDRSLDGILDVAEGDYTPSFTADTRPEPEYAVEQADMMFRVERLIQEALTEKQRTALVAAVIHGYSTLEVADQLNMKPNAVYKLLHDARVRLKRSLAEEGLTPDEVISVFS
jgi:RNA polymerase sigma-70 factor (ECF subfamily)